MVVKMNNRELRQFVNSQADDSRKHDALYEAYERIRQLEELNKVLAAEVDRMRPVVEAAVAYLKYEGNDRKELITLRARINSAAFQYEVNRPK